MTWSSYCAGFCALSSKTRIERSVSTLYARPFTLAAGSVSSSASKPFPVSDGQAIGGIFWRQDGKEIYFLASPQQAVMVSALTMSPAFEAGTPQLLLKMPTGTLAPAQLSNVATGDGQRFLYLAQLPVAQPTASANTPR